MKSLIVFLALVFTVSLHAFDDQKFLDALAEIETGNKPHLVGKSHERSSMQLSEATWYQYTTIPFRNASRPEFAGVSKNIALKHLKWIRARLAKNGHDVSVRNAALCWNLGYTRFTRGNFSRRARDYSQRCINIYNTLP